MPDSVRLNTGPGPTSAAVSSPLRARESATAGTEGQRPNTPEKLWEACCDFEAIFLGKLMQQMRATAEVPGAAIPASTAQDLMQEMFEGEVARTLSRRADCGPARLLFRHLEEQRQAPTDSSLEQPVPLDREPAWYPFQKETPEQPARSVWEPTWYALPKEESPGIELAPQGER